MEEHQSDSELWHWLYSIPWWGYTCLSFATVFVAMGLQALGGEDNVVLVALFALAILASLFTAIPAVISLLCRWAGKGEQYKRKPVRFHRRALGFSFLFFIVTIFFAEILPGARLAVNEAAARSEAESAAQVPWTEHTFSDGNFVVTTPSNWVKVEAPTLGNRGYTLIDEYHQMNVVVAATPKADVSVTSLDQLHQRAIANVAPHGSNHKAGITQSLLHQGFSVRQTKVAWEYSPQKVITVMRQIEFPQYWVEINLTAPPSMFDKYEERLNRIADSIRPQ